MIKAAQGLRLREGTIVDANIIEAPSSTKNRTGERDPEMHQTKKGNQWHFGMKLHIGVDSETGGAPLPESEAGVRVRQEPAPLQNGVRYRGLAKNTQRPTLLLGLGSLLRAEGRLAG